jgi:transcriptional regulator with PAS, ATPase and Fis domain
VIFSDGPLITKKELPAFFEQEQSAVYAFNVQRTLKEAIADFERQYIAHMLRINQYNKEIVASKLKISLSSLYRKIEDLHISLQG